MTPIQKQIEQEAEKYDRDYLASTTSAFKAGALFGYALAIEKAAEVAEKREVHNYAECDRCDESRTIAQAIRDLKGGVE